MRIRQTVRMLAICATLVLTVCAQLHAQQKPRVRMTNPVKALADRVRAHVNSEPLRFPNQHWVRGAYYAGLMAMYESTSDRAYLDDCIKWGKQVS